MKKQQEQKKKDKPEKEKELRLKKEFINTTPAGEKKGKKCILFIVVVFTTLKTFLPSHRLNTRTKNTSYSTITIYCIGNVA
jgi:hypothetical protein